MTKQQLFCSRDRLGVKPLYYFYQSGKFAFSSEIKALLDHDFPRKLNHATAYDFLGKALVDHVEQTLFEGILHLMPGHNLIFDLKQKSINLTQFYKLDEEYKNSKWKEKDLKELFYDAIKYRLIADVPVGSCLSGGIDSSSIVCGMREIAPTHEIKTFSLIFPGEKVNEESYQKEVIQKANTIGFFTTFDSKELIERLEEHIYAQDEPIPTFSMFGGFKVFELASKNKIKVLLDGQGADEILLGYMPSVKNYLLYLLRKGKIITFIPRLFHFLPRFLSLSREYYRNKKNSNYEWLKLPSSNNTYKFTNPTEEAIMLETYSVLPSLLRYEDKNSMHFALETRVPFCDYRLVEKVLNIPPEEKFKNGFTKNVFRQAIKGLIPQRILERKDKLGFKTPDQELFADELFINYIKSIFNSESFKMRTIWDAVQLQEMLILTISKKKEYSAILIRVLVFELWLRIFKIQE
jgi:asparagine synthase (glutamine-hydrolysing)